MIVDSLVHVTEAGDWFGTKCDANLKSLFQAQQIAGVQKSVLAALPTLNQNDFILNVSRQHEGLFIPFASLSFEKSLKEQITSLAHAGFCGVKIHPRYNLMSLDDPLVKEVLQLCGENQLVVLLCTICRHPAPSMNQSLEIVLSELAIQFPKTKIILAHGGYDKLLSVSEALRPFENVFFDLSQTLTRFRDASVADDIRFLLRTFDRRICFGSDFPEATYNDVLTILNDWGYRTEELNERGVLGDHLLQFLGL